MPSVGAIIGLDEVPHAIELARRSDGPPRIIVHPNAGASEATGNEGDLVVTEREDQQDIAEVLLRYATGIDRRDWPLFRTAFIDDCELDYGEIGTWNGVDAVTEFMEVSHAMAGHTMHRLTNQVITVSGDAAQSAHLHRRPDHGSGQRFRRQRHRLLRRRTGAHGRRLAHRPPSLHAGACERGGRVMFVGLSATQLA